jgi:hypothetical protein
MKTAGGAYLTVARTEGSTAQAAARMSGEEDAAFDLAAARLVLSVATAVGDGWGAPGRTLPALREFTHVQAEAKKSRAAEIADEWIRIREGGETALVLGCTRALLERDAASETAKQCEGYSSYRDAVLAVPMEELAKECGVAAPQMIALSERLQAGGAVVADGGAAAEEAAALNILLGTSACVARRAAAAPREWDLAAVRTVEEIEDNSLSVLLIDEPIPGLGFAWGPVERKLKRNAVVVAMAWSAQGAGRHAQWHVPAPVFVESPESAPAGPDEREPRFAFSEPVMAAPSWAVHAADFSGRIAGDSMSYADRVNGMGEVAAETKSAPLRPVRFPTLQASRSEGVRATPHWRSEAVSPLMGKLSKEWNLREVRA